MRTALAIGLIGLFACKDKGPSTPGEVEDTSSPSEDSGAGTDDGSDGTGETGETGEPPPPCEIAVVSTEPYDGQGGYYYRDRMEISFDDPAQTEADIRLLDPAGEDLSVQLNWDETGQKVEVQPRLPMQASTTYTLRIDLCEVVTEVAFTTSAYGAELEMESSALTGMTYHFDLGSASYTSPPGLGGLIAAYLSEPLLIGVLESDAESIHLIGAQGYVDDLSGDILQDTDYTTFDFGTADFTASPWFSADTPVIVLEYEGYEIPVYNFHLEGTFAADGSSVGGATAQGQADTRNLGPLLGIGDEPGAVCEMAATLGIDCSTCSVGGDYCLEIDGTFQPSPLLSGLTLVEVD